MSKDIWINKGFGYITKHGDKCMIRCFECGEENHSGCVSTGICAWCGFDANAPTLAELVADRNAEKAEIYSSGEKKCPID